MYCTRSDIELFFGAVNVAKWADLDEDADESKITARIAAAIEFADSEIDDALREGRYTIPLATVPTTIKDLSARLAGVWLYEARGVQDFDAQSGAPAHRLTWHRDYAQRKLDALRRGSIKLSISTTVTTVPQIVTEDDA